MEKDIKKPWFPQVLKPDRLNVQMSLKIRCGFLGKLIKPIGFRVVLRKMPGVGPLNFKCVLWDGSHLCSHFWALSSYIHLWLDRGNALVRGKNLGNATARCHNDLVIKDTVSSYSIISLLWSVTR